MHWSVSCEYARLNERVVGIYGVDLYSIWERNQMQLNTVDEKQSRLASKNENHLFGWEQIMH